MCVIRVISASSTLIPSAIIDTIEPQNAFPSDCMPPEAVYPSKKALVAAINV